MIRELGPPDLCHIIKGHSSNRNEPDIGSYHHVLGVDASSSASLAAYINSLQYLLSDSPGWFGANNNWKINSGTYCTYNSFSNVDIRVQIKIPGGVDAYAVNVRGERREITEQMWKETHVCSVIRAIMYSDPATYGAAGLRRVTPISNLDEENRFVDSVLQLFWEGWRLGSNAETQLASTARNLMVDGIIKYFSGQERYADCAAEILAPLAYAPLGGQRTGISGNSSRTSMDFKGIDPEVASLLAEMYIKGDQEVQAVRVMHQALRVKPSCYPMLNTQAEFLRGKKKLDAALVISRMAVKYAPSEFNAWAKLTEIYIERGDFQRALLTLNSCPMYTYIDHDLPRVPAPRRVNYIFNTDVLNEYNLGETNTNGIHGPVPSNNRSSVDSDAPGMAEEMELNERSEILRLPAPSLKGTFSKAYQFLSQIVSTIGWDELLLLRSQAFVMEEEYKSSVKPNVAVDDEDASSDLHDEDNQEDHVPLSVLSQRNSGIGKLPAESDKADKPSEQANGNVSTSDDKAVANGDVADTKEEAQTAENGSGDSPSAPADDPPADDTPADDTPVDASANQKNPPDQAKEEVSEKEKDTANRPKGKKKNKNKKGKAKEAAAKNAAADNTIANGDANNTDETGADKEENKDAAEESHEKAANGEAKESTIAALGSQMDEISLDDHGDTKSDSATATATVPETKPETKPEEKSEAKPEEMLTSPRNAVFDVKPAVSEATPGPNHRSSQQDETKTIEDEAHDSGNDEDPTYFRKRLCERWLDNHIMILYEDLRMYTAWRYRMDNFRNTGQPVTYQYTQAEWEALGELALRMHRPSDAKEAFEYALGIRFSARAWMRLLEMYTGTYADIQKEEALRSEGVGHAFPPITSTDSLMLALDAVVWLSVFGYRWHNSMTYPNPVCHHFVKLVRIHGLSKVRNSLVSMNLKTPVLNLVKGYFEVAEKFDVTGAKW
ncbi:bud site selection protein [Coemansia sp. RSA 2049]|nr:bud site selection protein [Coemansia sp. RSA 2049]